MDSLSELQARLTGLLQRRRSLVGDESAERVTTRTVTGNDRLSPAAQVEIYRVQFWLRHTGSLLEDFPGLGGVVGQRDWERLVEGYLERHPPRSYTLRDLGAQLPDYVAHCEFLEHRELCWDMARLEWAYVEAFDAADAATLDPAHLATVPAAKWPEARLILQPALRLLRVSYPVAALRRQLKSAGEAPIRLPSRQPQCLVVHRRQGGLFHSEVSLAAFELLTELAEGRRLGEALESLMQRVDDADELSANLHNWFRNWAGSGWFTRVELDP